MEIPTHARGRPAGQFPGAGQHPPDGSLAKPRAALREPEPERRAVVARTPKWQPAICNRRDAVTLGDTRGASALVCKAAARQL